MLENGARHLASGVNTAELKRGVDSAVKIVEKTLDSLAKPVKSKEEIYNVASVSANNDEEIGNLIADSMDKVGRDGVITVEESKSMETNLEVVDVCSLTGVISLHTL